MSGSHVAKSIRGDGSELDSLQGLQEKSCFAAGLDFSVFARAE